MLGHFSVHNHTNFFHLLWIIPSATIHKQQRPPNTKRVMEILKSEESFVNIDETGDIMDFEGDHSTPTEEGSNIITADYDNNIITTSLKQRGLPTLEEVSATSNTAQDRTILRGHIVLEDQWREGGVIATLSAPFSEKLRSDGRFKILSDDQSDPIVTTDAKYTVVLVGQIPMVIVNDWFAVEALTACAARQCLRVPHRATIRASLMWSLLQSSDRVAIPPLEVAEMIAILREVCIKACKRLGSAKESQTLSFHLSAMGAMIRVTSATESRVWVQVRQRHRCKLVPGLLTNVVLDTEAPLLRLAIEYYLTRPDSEDLTPQYVVLSPQHLSELNVAGIFFRCDSYVPAGMILEVYTDEDDMDM